MQRQVGTRAPEAYLPELRSTCHCLEAVDTRTASGFHTQEPFHVLVSLDVNQMTSDRGVMESGQ